MDERRLMRRFVLCGVAVSVASLAFARGPEALTEFEQLRRENMYLKSRLSVALAERDICKGQLAPSQAKATETALQQEIEKLRTDVEAAHPGFTLDIQTGALEAKPATAKDR